jgi:hypothetical protein
MDYSGDWLCANLFNVDESAVSSYLYLTNLNTGKTALFNLKFAHYAHDIVSVYPGQVYVNCIATDTMVGILFSPNTGQLIREDIHFTLPGGGFGCFAFNSMCSYRSKWYASLMMDGKEKYNGTIIEMSNQRAIYSNCNKPNSIFFNANHRLCWCEGGAGAVHLGDMIIYVNGYPQGIIEDRDAGGYWVTTHLCPGTSIIFIRYDGSVSADQIELGDLRVFKMIEAKGAWFSKWGT